MLGFHSIDNVRAGEVEIGLHAIRWANLVDLMRVGWSEGCS